MNRKTVYFVATRRIEVRDEPFRAPEAHEVMVETELSAISAGTEMLLYRGELPDRDDASIDPIIRGLEYPAPFGYCAVGRVRQAGVAVDPAWNGRLVFGFQPHTTAFVAAPSTLSAVPPGVEAGDAVFLGNLETAVNLVQDTAPLLGERVLVLGQGALGLMTAALLREFPLGCLVTADLHPVRRRASEQLGVTMALDPLAADFAERAIAQTGSAGDGYDTVIDLAGDPAALNEAIRLTAFSGRIVLGSWFGSKKASLDLGGRFHRSRIRLVSSQVSTIAPELCGRWGKPRRFDVAWDAMRRIEPSRWITHRVPIDRAAGAYHLLDTTPEEAIQVVFDHANAA